jgi:hypothetical protein
LEGPRSSSPNDFRSMRDAYLRMLATPSDSSVVWGPADGLVRDFQGKAHSFSPKRFQLISPA